MKWGMFCKKSGKCGGVFCKKSRPFLNAGCIMYSTSIFLFYILLICGCVRTQRTPPPAYGPIPFHPQAEVRHKRIYAYSYIWTLRLAKFSLKNLTTIIQNVLQNMRMQCKYFSYALGYYTNLTRVSWSSNLHRFVQLRLAILIHVTKFAISNVTTSTLTRRSSRTATTNLSNEKDGRQTEDFELSCSLVTNEVGLAATLVFSEAARFTDLVKFTRTYTHSCNGVQSQIDVDRSVSKLYNPVFLRYCTPKLSILRRKSHSCITRI